MTAEEKQAKVLEFENLQNFKSVQMRKNRISRSFLEFSCRPLSLCSGLGLSGYPFRGWLPVQDSLNRCAALGIGRNGPERYGRQRRLPIMNKYISI